MKLMEALEGLTVCSVQADLTQEITGVSYDSREVEKGHVFVAVPGCERDGVDYAAEAIARGAACVLCQQPLEGMPCVAVRNRQNAARS